jgi:diguanylate cyclase (GGDEF)-like protein/PAS domain S-box-containing protein
MEQPELERAQPIVLIVDDDVTVRLLERRCLEKAGFIVEEAHDGEMSLSAFENIHPDIVLLDVKMPGMDGFAACEEIRKLPEGNLTPILMVTGLDDMESINRAYEAGATDFITKSVNWEVLSHHVRYMVRASRAFSQLGKCEAKNLALLDAIPDLMFRISKQGIILECKQSKELQLFLNPQELIGKKLDAVLPKDVALKATYYVEQALQSGGTQYFEYQVTSNNTPYYYEARIVVSGKDEVLAIVRDISERKKAEQQIIHLAYYDNLTGLPNRLLFKQRLEQFKAGAQQYGTKVAIMFLDLDRFKHINDTLGHTMGDMLLKSVADRLLKCLRKIDCVARITTEGINENVARMNGDEFTVLFTNISDVQDVSKIAQRILSEISKPYVLGTHEVYVTASIGITIYPIDSEDIDDLLRYADTAMYHAKDKGRNNYQFYTESINAAASERFIIENQLRKALSHNEFQIHYQPQVDITNGDIIGTEALVRWMHPDRGLLFPETFIPLAEETSLIVPIGEWILQAACLQNLALQATGSASLYIAVNISSIQLRQKNFVEAVLRIIRDVGIDPCCLELELTESIIMEDVEANINTLHELKAYGLRLSIDDFGTGYSSLSYLKRLPVNTLKIDKSFIKDIEKDPDSTAIVKAIIALGHNLNLEVTAEGVETEQQLAFLQKYRCDYIQGYLFCKPLPANELIQFFREGKCLDVKAVCK